MEESNKIKQCTVAITHNCNLRCKFCYAQRAGYRVDDYIDFEGLKRIVDFCDEAGIQYIVFTGGEPLLYPRLLDIVKYIRNREHKMSIAIPTNGILLSDLELCKRLIESGVEYFDISIKGKDSQDWIKQTGKDESLKQITAIRNLSSLSIDFTCSMVVNMDNVDTFCDSVKLAFDNGAKQMSFTFVIDNAGEELHGISYLERNNPYQLISKFIDQIDDLNKITDEWWIEYSFPLCLYTDEQILQLKGRLASPCQIHKENAITFDTHMNLLPCDMFIDEVIGRFGSDFSTYSEFIKFKDNERYKKIMQPMIDLPSHDCESCQYLERCLGGCPVLWNNYSYEDIKIFRSRN